MSRRYDCSDPMERTRGIAEAVSAVRRGELIVLPTDTVYGVAADAFTPPAVTALLDAKGRGRQMPPPVLVGSVRAATALVDDLGTYGQDLIDEFWPGALTLVCRANPNLMWDLGETKGTVAVRMPMHELAVELLKETGPLAVSSANLSGQDAARTAEEAEKMLGDAVSVYLDAGASGHADPSTIVDLTGAVPRLLRAGAIPVHKIRTVVGVLLEETDGDADADADLDAPTDADTDGHGAGENGSGAASGAAPRVDLGKPSPAEEAAPGVPDAAAEPASDAAEPAEAPADSVPDSNSAADGGRPSLAKDSPPARDAAGNGGTGNGTRPKDA